MILRNATPKQLLALVFAAASVWAVPSYAETDAQLMASGQWRDPATGLIWMRCSIGQTWTGSTCSGTPIKLNWQDANDYFQIFNQNGFAGKTNWRLPRIEELEALRRCSNGWKRHIVEESRLTAEGRISIQVDKGFEKSYLPNGKSVPYVCDVDTNSSEPSIDVAIFPNTALSSYWSSTQGAGRYNHAGYRYAWGVSFYLGETDGVGQGFNGHVRAVRAAHKQR